MRASVGDHAFPTGGRESLSGDQTRETRADDQEVDGISGGQSSKGKGQSSWNSRGKTQDDKTQDARRKT